MSVIPFFPFLARLRARPVEQNQAGEVHPAGLQAIREPIPTSRAIAPSTPDFTVLRLDKRASGRKVQHQSPTYAADFEAAMCVGGLVGGENVSDAQHQNALLDQADQLVEQGRVGREGGR
jgi:hypothetical protein